MPLKAAWAEAGFDVELRHNRDDRGQIGLILDNHTGVGQLGFAIRTLLARRVDDPVNVFGRWSIRRRMAESTTGFFLAFFEFAAREPHCLAMRVAFRFFELCSQILVGGFQFRDPALQVRDSKLEFSDCAFSLGTV